jgi:hypothetical protein
LQALCGYHHRLKHQSPITVRPAGSGGPGDGLGGSVSADTLIWTMPSGRTYTTDPEPPPF